MTQDPTASSVDFDRLLKLRLVVARRGEMDGARWWNTVGLLGRKGALLLSRGFPRTHHFAQARVVFAAARARCEEVFNPPACMTLWSLPAAIEDQFDARWSHWLDERDRWSAFFEAIQEPTPDLLAALRAQELLADRHEEAVSRLRRSAEGRAVPLPGVSPPSDDVLVLLAAGFARGEVGKPAVPYARLEG